MVRFSNFKTEKPIAILASGNSLSLLDIGQLTDIRNIFYTIGLNYFSLFEPDMRFWLDRGVTDFWENIYATLEKRSVFATRKNAFDPSIDYRIKDKIDYWFDYDEDKLKHQMTAYNVVQLIWRYQPSIPICLFGYDLDYNNLTSKRSTGNIINTVINDNQKNHFDSINAAFNDDVARNPERGINVYNCNLNSGLSAFPRISVDAAISMFKKGAQNG